MNIKIKYFDKELIRLEKIGGESNSDWIDLRASAIEEGGKIKSLIKGHQYSNGDILKIRLGVAMELPEGYEAHILPRSSTFKKWGFTLVNSKGIIDESYCGDGDEWIVQMLCHGGGVLEHNDRIAQFRVMEKMNSVIFDEVQMLGNEDRGGIGSTGTR